jgi:peptidoglycan/xylan/chitin deacetylase (PgdA/CDA1 family)
MDQYKFPIVMFHRIEDQGYINQNGIYVSGEQTSLKSFTEKCKKLKNDFEVRHLSELIESLKAGNAIPENAAAITFDDGTRDQIEVALPVLLELGLSATFSVMTAPLDGKIPETFKMQLITGGKIPMTDLADDIFPECIKLVSESFAEMYEKGIDVPSERFIGEKHQSVRRMKYLVNYLLPANVKSALIAILFERIFGDIKSGVEKEIAQKMFFGESDLVNLVDKGMEVACHTYSHFNLATLPDSQLRLEIVESKKRIATICQQIPRGFSYPSGGKGSYTDANVKYLKKNYDFALITGDQKTWVKMPGCDFFELPRVHEANF